METAPQVTAGSASPPKPGRMPSSTVVLLVTVNTILLVGTAWAMAVYGSVGRAVGYNFRGETLFLDDTEKSFGVIDRGETGHVMFRLRNIGRTPVRHPGFKYDVQLHSGRGFPIHNPCGDGSRSDHSDSSLAASGCAEEINLDVKITLFTNNADQSRVPIHVKGKIREQAWATGIRAPQAALASLLGDSFGQNFLNSAPAPKRRAFDA